MRRSLIETVMGAIVLMVAVFFVVTAYRSTSSGGDSAYIITMELDDASGVGRGTDIRIAGVKVGAVAEQRLDPETLYAVVELSIDQRYRLPEDSRARVVPDGLLGGVFVKIEPGRSETTIPAGGKLADAEGPVNVVDLIGKTIFLAVEKVESEN